MVISCLGKINRKHAIDLRISSGARGSRWPKGVPAIGVQEVHGHNMRAKFFQRKSQVTSVLAALPHAQDAPGTDLDPRML